MLKRILILGLAAVALALVAPAIGVGGAVGVGGDVAQAQTDPNADAPDQGVTPDAPDQGVTPDAPDQGDAPDAPDEGDGSGCADGASVHASGEDCIPAPQAPAKPTPQPRPAPKSETHKEKSGGGSGAAGESAGSEITPVTPQVVQTTTPVSAGVDTGTIPQGGIQAGAGGTADDGSMSGLLWGGGLIFVLAASGLALRRRDGLGS
jgi:hypothetical protein